MIHKNSTPLLCFYALIIGYLSLQIEVLTYSHPLDMLPPNLLHLSVSASTGLMEPLTNLPISLISLKLATNHYPHQIMLPPYLSQLSCTIEEELYRSVRHTPLFASFPLSLQDIQLSMPTGYMPVTGFLSPNIHKLELCSSIQGNIIYLTTFYQPSKRIFFLFYLHPTILTCSPDLIATNTFLQLPPNLTYLKLHIEPSEIVTIILPPSLTSLDFAIVALHLSEFSPFPIHFWPPHLKILKLFLPEGVPVNKPPPFPTSLRHLTFISQHKLQNSDLPPFLISLHSE
jgi:hypothetical protein